MTKNIGPKQSLCGTIRVPGDKSISHRAVMFGAIADGVTEIMGFLDGEDCRSTIACFRQMGVNITQNGTRVTVEGKGLRGLAKPKSELNVGNSGTTIRLMSGILAAQDFACMITGDEMIQRRPMDRVIAPLTQMGADIQGTNGGFAPLRIRGSALHGISYDMPMASAQVKSAILLASLYADGETVVREPHPSRDHTERMLKGLGADIRVKSGNIVSKPVERFTARAIEVPGDISSAAFFIVAALVVPGSRVVIESVNVNETRTGILDALRAMGADIQMTNARVVCGEEVADLAITSSKLQGIEIGGAMIPRMIDEIPVLAIAALCAEGETVIRDARELKVKESNRIRVMAEELAKLGVTIHETDDGMIIPGGQRIAGGEVDSRGDHRIAMSMAVAGLLTAEEVCIIRAESADVSFPTFYELLESL